MYKAPKSSRLNPITLLIVFLFIVLMLCSILFISLLLHSNTESIPVSSLNSVKEDTRPPSHSLVIESLMPTEESLKTSYPLYSEQEDNYPLLSAADGRTHLDEPFMPRGIILVNRRHPVNRHYKPELDEWGVLQKEARSAFNTMTQAAQKDGITYTLRSGYRSFEKQFEINQYYLKTDPGGIASVDTYSAPAGASEHQTGLALDLDNGNGLTSDFDQTPAGKWLQDHAYEYGFILRFPKDKEHITGYHYEPWHFRYVGQEVAKAFGPWNTLTLEEYLDAEPAPAPQYD